jgi:hypothetical protein
MNINTAIKLEEAAKFLAAYLITLHLGYSWWIFFALLLLPDLSMLGYLFNSKAGAITYNIFHHQGIAIVVCLAGFTRQIDELILAGIILFGHSAMDRIFGYGLKYYKGFRFTHLGQIGKAA